jgi:type II secretory ATPase GspE/PulE/Tfp pilus assembly ATPase PilB-like protein
LPRQFFKTAASSVKPDSTTVGFRELELKHPYNMANQASGRVALDDLQNTVNSTVALTSQLEAVASNHGLVPQADAKLDPSINALSVAHDAATLVKAHTTKISLLIINEPFTPTAITKVLRELVAGPLPALAAATQLCDPKRYTQALSRDLRYKAGRVFSGFRELVQKIPADGKALAGVKKDSQQGSIAATGLLWSACDDVVALAKLGVAGYLMRQVEQFRDTLKDIMEELKEWAEEESEDEDDEDDEDDDDDTGHHSGKEEDEDVHDHFDAETSNAISTQAMLDDLMDSEHHIPKDDPEKIRPRVDSSMRRLRLTTLLYQATVKRRLKTLPPLPLPAGDEAVETVSRLDEAMHLLKLLPERFTTLMLAFYGLDVEEIDKQMDNCLRGALKTSEQLLKPWSSEKDEFSDWALRYKEEMEKA